MTNNSGNLVACLTRLFDLLADDIVALAIDKVLVLLGCEVEVVEASLRPVGVLPRDREVRDELLSETDTGTRVGREVDSWNAELACELRALVEELVFLRTE